MAEDKKDQMEVTSNEQDDVENVSHQGEKVEGGGDEVKHDLHVRDVGASNQDSGHDHQDWRKEDEVNKDGGKEGEGHSKLEQGEVEANPVTKDESCAAENPVEGNGQEMIEESAIKQHDKNNAMRKKSSAVSSIDVSIPQVEKDESNKSEEQDENNDKDDDDDTQSVVMGTTKSVAFSIHHNIDDVDEEIAKVTMLNKASDDQMSSFDVEVGYGGRAETTNTPVTVITEYQDSGKSTRNQTPSSENIYEHAMFVMRNRSTMTNYTQSPVKSNMSSVRSSATALGKTANGLPIYPLSTVVAKIKEPPFTDCTNCSFYVVQERIQPVPPVKAWKGYHTNVYFEPVVCKKAVISPNSTPRKHPQNLIQQSYDKTSKPSSQADIELPKISPTNKTVTQTTSNKSIRTSKSAASVRTGAKSRATVKTQNSTSLPRSCPLTTGTSRQLAVLDKLSVLDNMDSNIREDIKWIDGLESTGTLQVGEPMQRTGSTTQVYTRSGGSKHYKMRICRGLVSHNLSGRYNAFPALGVSGGKIVDSPSKLEYLEQGYEGESHFLSNPHGMFSSPVPLDNVHSSSSFPPLHHRQPRASSNIHQATDSSTVNLTNHAMQLIVSGK